MPKPQRALIIGIVSFITVAAIVFVLGLIVPELSSRYKFSSVKEARLSAYIEDAEVIDEIGDTNGPYRFVSGIVSGFGKPFDFELKCSGENIKWTQPGSSNTWFVVHVFENQKGNHFAVVMKRTKGN